MKIWTDTYQYDKLDNFSNDIFQESTCFYDIETTGLMSKRNHIYLIGCGTRIGNEVTITQFFSEYNDDEPELLKAFLNFISNYNELISFNGIGFDLPFIVERCKLYGISELLRDISQLDIFRECKKIKGLLHLDNYKQKTIEQFLGIHREDEYNGGQLIEVYHQYVKQPNDELEHLLKLHNYEDVKGMFELIPILTYCHLLSGNKESTDNWQVIDTSTNSYYPYDSNKEELELIVKLQFTYPVPTSLRLKGDHYYGIIKDDTLTISIQLYSGELKYFIDDYKNYDYIPDEDIVIHKSLSSFMDVHRKEKATRQNCYIKKTGTFIPVIEKKDSLLSSIDSNIKFFKREYRDSLKFIEYIGNGIDSKLLQSIIILYLKNA